MMNQAELIKTMETGTPCCIVEYRSSVPEAIKWRDGEGRTQIMKRVTHNVESGVKTFQVNESLPEETDVSQYKAPFQKGQILVWQVTGLSIQKGVKRYNGILTPYQANGK